MHQELIQPLVLLRVRSVEQAKWTRIQTRQHLVQHAVRVHIRLQVQQKHVSNAGLVLLISTQIHRHSALLVKQVTSLRSRPLHVQPVLLVRQIRTKIQPLHAWHVELVLTLPPSQPLVACVQLVPWTRTRIRLHLAMVATANLDLTLLPVRLLAANVQLEKQTQTVTQLQLVSCALLGSTRFLGQVRALSAQLVKLIQTKILQHPVVLVLQDLTRLPARLNAQHVRQELPTLTVSRRLRARSVRRVNMQLPVRFHAQTAQLDWQIWTRIQQHRVHDALLA